MVHLNRNALTQQQLHNLYLQFSSTVSPHNPQHAEHILTEILGHEEQVMVAKRLAVVVLLVEGTSKYKISRLLKLSESTIEKIAQRLKQGQFDYTLKKVSKTKKDYFAFLSTLDSILHLGGVLPHYNGIDRYKHLR